MKPNLIVLQCFAATDKQCVTLLGLLDLNAAFDCVDHVILLDRLKSVFGLDGCALDWLISFLEARTQQVCYNGCSSAIIRLLFARKIKTFLFV
jgi:hypothetical protein